MNNRYTIDRTKHLSDSQYEKLEQRLRETDSRDHAILLLLLYTGARPTEVLNLRGKDLDKQHKSIYIRGLKGSDNREIPVPDWLFSRITPFADQSFPNARLFQIGYQRLNQIWQAQGIKGHSLKSLRHTFAVRHYRRTQNLQLIQTALGHRSIQNTIVYAKYQMRMTEMRSLLVE